MEYTRGGRSLWFHIRESIDFGKKLAMYKQLGFDGVQLHDDDAVLDLNDLIAQQVINKAKDLKKKLEDYGLAAEFVALRLWEDQRTIDGVNSKILLT